MKFKGNSFGQRVMLGIVFVLIFVYTFYHMTSLFGEEIETYAAGITTERTVISEDAYLFRDETVLTSLYTGAVDYRVASGTKVAKDQELAAVYENGTAQTRQTLLVLDQQIALLEKSVGSSLSALEMGALKQSVKNSYNEIVKLLALREASGLSGAREELLVGLNQMDGLSQGDQAEAYATLDALREQRSVLLAQGGDSQLYRAEQSGYFYTQTDGCEEFFTLSAVQNLTPERFASLKESVAEASASEDAYGKISYSSEWMLVLPVDIKLRDYFELGQTYSAEFPQNDHVQIPITLENMIEDTERAQILLVFSADRLPTDFSFDRCQGVRMEIDSISGIYVPKYLVERSGGARGVYVLRGNVVYFRRIEIVYTGEDYYLVRSGIEDKEYPYLQVNDLIILNGKNMFDGRVLD